MKNKEKFIQKAKNKFHDKYDYCDINYVDSKTKIKIKCNEHNDYFLQVPAEHLRGRNGCKFCQEKNITVKDIKEKIDKNKNKILTIDEFIKRAKKSHGDKYDYSKVEYINSQTKVKIICPEHGEFEQAPVSHIRGKGCNLCAIKKRKQDLTCNINEFILKSKKSHGDKYDYSKVEYINSQTKVKIICPEHGEFWQLPYDHISKHGCNKCSSSISNAEIEINGLITKLSSMSIIKQNMK